MAASEPPRPGGLGKRLAVALLSALAALFFFELALAALGLGEGDLDDWRTQGYHEPDPFLIYAPKPNARATYRTDEFVEEVRTNSLGLRDDEPADPSTLASRILVLGDSMTFGHGVSAEEAYPNVLERLYAERGGGRVEVINAGVKGYGTDQEIVLFFERLQRLRPDVVVVGLYVNDFYDNVMRGLLTGFSDHRSYGRVTTHPLYRLGRFKQKLPRFLYSTRTARWIATRWIEASRPLAPIYDVEDLVITGRDRSLMTLRNFAARAPEWGFELVVCCLPYDDRSGPPGAYAYVTERLEESLAESGLGENVRLLNLAGSDWHRDAERFFFRNDTHMRPAGHERVARELFAFLEAEDESADDEAR